MKQEVGSGSPHLNEQHVQDGRGGSTLRILSTSHPWGPGRQDCTGCEHIKERPRWCLLQSHPSSAKPLFCVSRQAMLSDLALRSQTRIPAHALEEGACLSLLLPVSAAGVTGCPWLCCPVLTPSHGAVKLLVTRSKAPGKAVGCITVVFCNCNCDFSLSLLLMLALWAKSITVPLFRKHLFAIGMF